MSEFIEKKLKIIDTAFSESTINVLTTMTGLLVSEKEYLHENADYSGVMFLKGVEYNYIFTLSTSEESVRILMSYMTGMLPQEISKEELSDGISELVNMIAGKVKIIFSGTENHFKLTSPFTIEGDNHVFVNKKNIPAVSKIFFANDLKIFLKIIII